MTNRPLTQAHLEAVMTATLAKTAKPRQPIGVRYDGPWQVESSMTLQDHKLEVVTCPSPLAFRVALSRQPEVGVVQVLLTQLSEDQLGADVVCRLYGGGLQRINEWLDVKTLFQLPGIDSRVIAKPWMAHALLEASHLKHKLFGRRLTEHLAWNLLREMYLGFKDQPDLIMLTAWCADPDKRAAYKQTPEMFRNWLPGYLRDNISAAAAVMVDLVNRDLGERILAAGLVCTILYANDVGDHSVAIATARVRLLERDLKLPNLSEQQAADWAAAAESVISSALHGATFDGKISPVVSGHCKTAEQILAEIGLSSLAWKSAFLALGFEQRLDQLAHAMTEALAPRFRGDLDRVEAGLEWIRNHRYARLHPRRVEIAAMAVRLLRRLRGQERHADTFPEAVQKYHTDGGFVDWTRRELHKGELNTNLEKVYKKLISAVTQIREEENQRFGKLIRDWSKRHHKSGDAFVLMEDVLDRVVVPLTRLGPVLLLVMDGMSMETYRELQDDLLGAGWKEIGENRRALPVIPLLPTRTNTCRASLFSGKPSVGTASKEVKAFREHKQLAAHCRKHESVPYLWHKEPLSDMGGGALAGDVRSIIRNEDHPVTALVINSIDANLATGEQTRETWRSSLLHQVQAALHDARLAGRAVILTADHGHVLEWDTSYREEAGAGERWRPARDEPTHGELLFSGPRVLTKDGRAIMPWSEKLRYASKKYGYHGGVSPQEAVVPLGVFVDINRQVSGSWGEVGSALPDWWHPGSAPRMKRAAESAPAKTVAANQPDLFEAPATLADALLASPDFQECQSRINRRNRFEDHEIRKFITAFESRGFRLTHKALATQMDKQPFRIPGLVSRMNRLLNLDGYAVLSDEDGYYILDEKMLKTQFRLE